MTEHQPEARAVCEHFYASHCYRGMSVRLCMTCHEPDWDDLAEQLASAARGSEIAASDPLILAPDEFAVVKKLAERIGLTSPAPVPDGRPAAATDAGDALLAAMHERVRAALDTGSGEIERKTDILDRQAEAVMAVVEDEAISRMADQFVAESRFRSMQVRNGVVEIEAQPAREIVAQWIGASRTLIGDTPNYIEMDVSLADTGEGYTFYLMRRGRLTPHKARQIAEVRTEAAEAKLAEIEALCRHQRASAPESVRTPSVAVVRILAILGGTRTQERDDEKGPDHGI